MREERQHKILLVEDSELVLLSLENLIEDMGWVIDGPATSLGEALQLAGSTDADIALLDVNLDGEYSWEAADRLKARGIPVVFTTGYDITAMIPDRLAGTPVVAKPFAIETLEDLLRALV